MKKIQSFLSENFQFLEVKFSTYLNRRVFIMKTTNKFFKQHKFSLWSNFWLSFALATECF